VGYDLVTGLGTPVADVLIPASLLRRTAGRSPPIGSSTVTAADVNANLQDLSTVPQSIIATIFNAELLTTVPRGIGNRESLVEKSAPIHDSPIPVPLTTRQGE